MENEKFWKLQELFEQYYMLENLRFDYVKEEDVEAGCKIIRNQIEQLIRE